jgi:hypothetical protein
MAFDLSLRHLFTTTDQPTMSEPDFRAALKQLVEAIDGWQIGYGLKAEDPLFIALNYARELLRTADECERLSSGKLVSERLDELFTEVEQLDLNPVEVILGNRAFLLYCKELHMFALKATQIRSGYHGLPVTRSDSEADEYVAIECQR